MVFGPTLIFLVMAKHPELKYGIVTDIDIDAIEITELPNKINFTPKKKDKNVWWVDWAFPARTMPIGAKVSYYEVDLKKKYPNIIRSIERVDNQLYPLPDVMKRKMKKKDNK